MDQVQPMTPAMIRRLMRAPDSAGGPLAAELKVRKVIRYAMCCGATGQPWLKDKFR